MKKNVLLLTAAFSLFFAFRAITNSSGAPAGSAGSPASNGTCGRAGCHNGPSQSTETVTINTDIPTNGFEENTTYNINVTANDGGRALSRIGFQAGVEDGNGAAGTINVTDANRTRKAGSFITHTFTGINASNGGNSWTFEWNSGNAPDGSTVYTAVNFADGTGGTSGDVIVTRSLSLTKNNSIGIAEASKTALHLYPNPAKHQLTVAGVDRPQGAWQILNLSGQVVRTVEPQLGAQHWQIDIRGLRSGGYFLQTEGGERALFYVD